MSSTEISQEAPAPVRAGNVRLGQVLIKIALLGLFNAFALFLMLVLAENENWGVLAAAAVVTGLVDWVYLSKRALPAKYLTPGLIFLAIFQVFVIIYTFYVAFTNYSTGHVLTKDQAIQALLSQNQRRVEDSPAYPLTVVERNDELGFLVTDLQGVAYLGTERDPLEEVDATFTGDKATAVEGWKSLSFAEILQNQSEIFDMVVPVTANAAEGSLRTLDGSTAYRYVSNLKYDASSDTLTNVETGDTYVDGGEGNFVRPDGSAVLPGWTITVGWDNFERALTEPSIRGPLGYVTAWTLVFATLSMVLTFALGLLLAITFNDPRMRGRRFYRIVMVLPYAFPAFLSALIWSGMLSQSFGFVNQVLLGGASIPWLTDPTLAKVAVLLVNLWLGFPYMFLVSMGALQSIPEEVQEAARTDGAGPWQVFRRIKLPLLLVSVAPVLIATFAFNFNNFNVIYLVTGGGPRDTSASIPVGHTDILISMVYKVAFTGQNRDYGLASAFSILIFVIVAVISIISFRRTKALEEIH
jgi:arabinogalactan oligomer/maltooligosaccharide transport system permease protein